MVQFDGDEDDSGECPEQHIPARFITLVPRELPGSKSRKRKSTTASSNKKNFAAEEKSIDDMLFELGGGSNSRALHLLASSDMIFSAGSTPPLDEQSRSKRSRVSKQKGDELASSHFV